MHFKLKPLSLFHHYLHHSNNIILVPIPVQSNTKPIQDTVTPSWLWGVFLSIMHITRWHKIAAIRSRWALRTYWHPIGHCTTIEDFISWCCFVYRSEDSRLNPTVRMELHGELCFPWSWPWCPNTKAIAFVAPGLIPLFGPLTCLLRPL